MYSTYNDIITASVRIRVHLYGFLPVSSWRSCRRRRRLAPVGIPDASPQVYISRGRAYYISAISRRINQQCLLLWGGRIFQTQIRTRPYDVRKYAHTIKHTRICTLICKHCTCKRDYAQLHAIKFTKSGDLCNANCPLRHNLSLNIFSAP